MKNMLLMTVLIGGLSLSASAINWDNALISGTTPGGQVFFEPNEEMVFTLQLEGVKETLPPETYFVDWERRGDDGLSERGRAALPFPAGGLVLKTKSAKPGFVCIEANVVTKDGKRVPKNHRWEKRVFFQGGAGVRPNEIPMAKKPADYDAFWQKCLDELAAVPIKAEMKPVACKDAQVKLYAVSIACAGPQPVTGYLTIPVAASKTNRMPILASYRGASEEEQLAPSGGPHDRISMLINPNGYELGRGKEYVKKFFREVSEPGHGYGMGPKQNENPDTSYWKYCALRAIRYLQWIKTLPEWNGRELVLGGGSQGDWQCYFGAAFVPGVTRMNGNGSWGCDWTGQSTLGRLRSTYRPGCWFPGMAYFDPVFAAERITCPVNISFSGLGDYVSPPASLTLVYRNLKGPKSITYVQGSTHGWRPAGTQRFTVDGGLEAAVRSPAEPEDLALARRLLASREVVYRLDAAATNSFVRGASGEVTAWRSRAGGYSFKSLGAAPKVGPNGVVFAAGAAATLAGDGVVTQRTVFVVCSPRAPLGEFAGVWGEKGRDNGLRIANRSCAWENVTGGPDFNSVGSLMVNGATHTGAVSFNPGERQVIALRHDADIPLWGSCSRAVFVPAVGGYVKGRPFVGEVQEVVAFSRLLDANECRAVSAELERKWSLTDGETAFDPLDAVRRDLAAGKREISVAKRAYAVRPKDGGAYLSLKGLSDVTIDFGGSELRGLVNTCFFRLEACTNVTIRNVTLDYVTLPFTQGEIVASDADATWTVKLIPGYPVAPDGGDGAWPFQVYDRATLELKNPMRCWKGFKLEKTGPDTYRVSGGVNRRGDVGDYVVWGLPKPKGEQEGDHVSACDAVYSRATVRCIFENVTEYATPGGRAFEEHLTEGNVYRNCSIVRRPPETDPIKRGLKRLRSGNHDAFMSRRAVEGPKILGCTAMYHCDDAVNISGMYGVVSDVTGRKVRLIEYIPSVFHVGDRVQAMSFAGEALPAMTVAAVRPGLPLTDEERAYMKTIGLWQGLADLCRSAVEIEVDDPSALKRGDAVISDRAQGNGFEIRGCRFGRNRALGIRLRASHGTIADNVIDRPEGTGLFIGPEYEWLEGGLAEDVLVESNVFVGVGITIGGTAAHRKRLPRSAYRNVIERGNVFTSASPVTARIDPLGYIRDELKRGAKRISLPKARYWLTPEPGAGAYLNLEKVRDVEIDFGGAEFVGTRTIGMVALSSCTNVTLRNLTIDYADLPFTQAVIEKVDAERSWDVRIVEGYPCPPTDRLGGYGDAHNNSEPFWPIQAYGAKSREPVNFMRFRDNVAIVRTGERTYRISGGQNRRGEVGDIAVWTIREPGRYAASAVGAGSSSGCLFENIAIYSTPHGCAFAEGSAEGNVYRNCSIDRRPLEADLFRRAMPRLRSGNHDAFNSRCSFKGPTLEGCTFRYHCDDCVNISGFYAFVTKREGRKLRLVAYGGGQGRLSVGDSCQLMTDDGRSLPDATAIAIRNAGPVSDEDRRLFPSFKLWEGLTQSISSAFEIELDEERDLPPGSAVISNRRMGNGFRILNCTMGHNRARGLLIKASDGVMENNLLEGVEGWAVQISQEYEWMEGGCSRNLSVRGNTIRRNGAGVYVGGNNCRRKQLPADAHLNIAIAGNVFEGNSRGVAVVGCTGLDLRGNEFRNFSGEPYELVNVADVKRD